ncbi:MAG: hypothetical protein ACYDH0_05225 [Candidatus Aminicenantales bacterium]
MFKAKGLIPAVLAVLFSMTLCFAQTEPAPANVGGKWEITTQTPQGDMVSDITFVQEGDKLTVNMVSDFGEMSGTGSVKGNEVEWTLVFQGPEGEFRIVHHGKVEGDAMSGQAEAGEFGTLEWKAVRKPA